jgi:hypothetical protein
LGVPDLIERHERGIVLALTVAAACRVFLFSAAFPYFNNVDEPAHFDLVMRYSHGEIPRRGVERYSREAIQFIVLYGSPEYFSKPGSPVGIPGWLDPNMGQPEVFARAVASFQEGLTNHEAGGFPAYYAVAGSWLALGRAVGLAGGNLLYWIRFLNVLVLAGLVWLSYWIASTLLPGYRLARLGIPLLLAFCPQDVFYSVNSDVLTPPLFALAFIALVQIVLGDRPMAFHAIAGLVVSATFLTKSSNVTVLGLLGLVVVAKVRSLHEREQLRSHLPRLAVLLAAGALPAGAWLARNRIVLGDFSGSAEKIAFLHWTVKPVAQWWHHPLFSPAGLAYFLAELTRTFWRGEFVWHLERVASPAADLFYVGSTGVFLAASAFALWRGTGDGRRRLVLSVSFFVLGVSVLLLAALSLVFDFDDCWAPSRASPYLVAGRLIGSALVPFLLLYLDGLGHVLSWARLRLDPLVVVVLIAAGITFSEIALTVEVFHSPYNWVHLH